MGRWKFWLTHASDVVSVIACLSIIFNGYHSFLSKSEQLDILTNQIRNLEDRFIRIERSHAQLEVELAIISERLANKGRK